jgi:hypothetical protein
VIWNQADQFEFKIMKTPEALEQAIRAKAMRFTDGQRHRAFLPQPDGERTKSRRLTPLRNYPSPDTFPTISMARGSAAEKYALPGRSVASAQSPENPAWFVPANQHGISALLRVKQASAKQICLSPWREHDVQRPRLSYLAASLGSHTRARRLPTKKLSEEHLCAGSVTGSLCEPLW